MTDDPHTGAGGEADPLAAPDPGPPPPPPPGAGALIGAACIQADDIATLFGSQPGGVAAFKAFVSDSYTCSASAVNMRRLYTDDTGWEWVEATADDIVGQLRPGPNATDPRSLVFLRKDALVTMCRVDYASQVKDEAFGDIDPRGGGNPPPRRPPY